MLQILQRLATPFLMMGWASYYFAQVSQQKPASQYLIRPVFYGVCVLFVYIVVQEIRKFLQERKMRQNQAAAEKRLSYELKTMVVFVVGTAGYLLLMPALGFLLTTPVFLAAAFLYLKSGKKMAVLLAAALTAFVYLAFKVLLGVPLPAGILNL